MQFSGSELTLKRSVYTQSGNFGFVGTLTVDNTTGQYRFGMSGAGGALEFTLSSGRLYYGNQFIHTYRSYQPLTIEAQFTTGSANVLKDGTPLIYGAPKATGNYDYLYLTRANAGMAATWDVEVSGNSTPTFTISQLGYLLTSGQAGVTGYFANQSRFPLRVFDSRIQATQNYQFGRLAATLAAPGTGTFVYSGDFNEIDLSQPVLTTFNTSYQDASILFTIVDARTLGRFVYLTAPTDFSFNETGILNRDATYLNYSGGLVTYDYPTSLVFQLRYGTGSEPFTGVWDLATGSNNLSLVSAKTIGLYSASLMSGSGMFAPNSQVNFQITYSGTLGNQAQLVISGANILNPINQQINL